MHAQEHTDKGAVVQVTKSELNNSKNILNNIIKITNNSGETFAGYVVADDVEGIKAVSDIKKQIVISPFDSMFIVSKFLLESTARAGRQSITYTLFDREGNAVSNSNVSINIPDKIDIGFSIETTNVFVSNPNDSIRIKAYVENKGNRTQPVSVVFIIPGASGNKIFTEKKISVFPSEKQLIEFSFFPSIELLNQQQFQVNIFASHGNDKQIFGNTSVMVWNMASEQIYQNSYSHDSDFYNSYSPNSLSVSYRQMGSDNYTVQTKGSGSFDLPVGYVDFQGNLYRANNSDNLYMTNSSMSYRFLRHEVTLGNVQENMEVSMYGRGAKAFVSNSDNSKRFTAGFIDNEFNLLSSSGLLSKSYGAYLSFQSGLKNIYKGLNSTILYQYNSYDRMRNYMSSNEGRFALSPDWIFTLKGHGVMSYIESIKDNKFSGAAELLYRGKIKDMAISGNIYWSSPYFAGNRKGFTSVSQTLEKTLKSKNILRANLSYFKIEPKSYSYNIRSYSQNLKADLGFSLLRKGRFRPSFSYQLQTERTNSYNSFFDETKDIYRGVYSHRLIEQLTWNSKNLKHLVMLTLENGLVKYPELEKFDFQMKVNSTYLYKWLSVNAVYQRGAYFLSEYALSKDRGKKYERFIFSTSASKDLWKGKVAINIGQNIMYDYISGFTPSFYSNVIYNPSKKYSLYLNSSYYQYKVSNASNKVFNFEVGFTINFSGRRPSSGKKSKLIASAFYDRNSNNIFDEEDTPATDYHITVDKRPFSTDEEGQIVYKNIPFGEYHFMPISQNGWFYSGSTINVDKYKTNVSIPLQQTGTIIGHIELVFDKKKSLDSKMNVSGIRIHIKGTKNAIDQDVITDNDGKITQFLPPGEYTAEVRLNSLSKEMTSISPIIDFQIKATTITNLPPFKIQIKEKVINVKKFTQ